MMRIFLFIFIGSSAGCMEMPKEHESHPVRLCIIRPVDKMCWFDKGSKDGIPIDKLDGYFAEKPDDLDEMVFGLNQCKDK